MIGYACLNESLPDSKIRTLRKANVTPDALRDIISHNLNVLNRMLDYNIKHHIQMFRMSSDIIPFGSDHETNTLNWASEFAESFARLGLKIAKYQLRLSMHPGQYTVLNSPDPAVVSRSIAELDYHARFMEALGLDRTHKMILHIGGVYGDKKAAMARFIEVYHTLSDNIKERLIIENDDRLYTISDVLSISQATGAPVVYDNLHNTSNLSDSNLSDADWLEQVVKTWKPEDGKPKIHYSQQRANARIGAHTQTIYLQSFLEFYQNISDFDVDIMLEVKDKNLSAVKCSLATHPGLQDIRLLEKEWAAYKYLILYYSPKHYQAIRQLLKDKTQFPVVKFYSLIEECLSEPPLDRYQINAIDHIWGYFKKKATDKEKASYLKAKTDLMAGKIKARRLLNWLYKLAIKYDQPYLKKSLIFHYRPHG
ncbi:UV DNA damage repair endonuclease UvsE [Streptococcus moroccensis]|uniref:UV DNA damage endonuclease n=1 Tax=Streptococcus moroccensis TaxID=1451356 RepID=A0ABT9YU46_9STRE|nr:UV DNA damage repair endonuclease UvsE [Streptococcus moroccensis]MDQ0223508.1 UV DNA damage endonuclease [Streptococcus moroccensis]